MPIKIFLRKFGNSLIYNDTRKYEDKKYEDNI